MARATPPLLKHLNERAVLEAIRSGAPISRAEIARRTGISKPTVSLALRTLVGNGIVRETSPDPRQRPGAGGDPGPARAALRRGFLRAGAGGGTRTRPRHRRPVPPRRDQRSRR